MNGRIVISLGLLVIALTIAGSAADGETTPAAAEVVAAPSSPEAAPAANPVAASKPAAASNPAVPSNRDLKRFLKIEQDSSGGSGGLKCYEYLCGEKVVTPGSLETIKVECEPEKTVSCKSNICLRSELKGTIPGSRYGELDYVGAGCAPTGSKTSGCEETDDLSKIRMVGTGKNCFCNTELCNGSSVSSPIAFVTVAALVIAAKVNIF